MKSSSKRKPEVAISRYRQRYQPGPGAPVLLLAAILVTVSAPTVRAQLVVDPPRVDFGEQGQNKRPGATVLLQNQGTSPLVVTELKKSCSCIELSPAKISDPIPPGGSVPLRISMGSGRAMGRLHKHVTVITEGLVNPQPISIPVSMRVLEDFTMEPRQVRIYGVKGGKPEQASVRVLLRDRRKGEVTLEIKGFKSFPGRPTSRYLRARVAPVPRGQEITIELDPAHPEGPISAELEASLNGKSFFVPVSGEMFAWIKVSPNYINFSRATSDDPGSFHREVLLSTGDGTPFKILEIQWRPAGQANSPVTLELSSEAVSPPGGLTATAHKIICKAVRKQDVQATFFGTVTVRTDHPRKPLLSLKYSGFFARSEKKG